MIDASVSAKWYLRGESDADAAVTVFHRYEEGAISGQAPYLARHELASALTGACRSGRLDWQRVGVEMRNYVAMGISIDSDDQLFEAAFTFAHRYPVSLYDAIYLGLADALGGRFVTADRRMYNGLAGRLPWVVWLGDFPS